MSATKSLVSRTHPALIPTNLAAYIRMSRSCPVALGDSRGGRSTPNRGMAAIVGPKNWPSIVDGLANGTVSAIKCTEVTPPYSRCANTPTVRNAISRCTTPPGRSVAAILTAPARTPRTVTDADDGEKGPRSASARFVATNVGKRGSIGVSNSQLPPSGPAGTGTTPSTDAPSTAGILSTRPTRHGSDIVLPPKDTRPRTASPKSAAHSCALQTGSNPHACCSRVVSINGRFSGRTYSVDDIGSWLEPGNTESARRSIPWRT